MFAMQSLVLYEGLSCPRPHRPVKLGGIFFTCFFFHPRDALSVCLSVTIRHCVQMVKHVVGIDSHIIPVVDVLPIRRRHPSRGACIT